MSHRHAARWQGFRKPLEPVAVDTAPLIDIVFQLLIFFMLTSSFVLQPGIRVALPKAATGHQAASAQFVVTLTKDHLIYWEDEVVTMEELRAHLEAAGGQKPVVIRSDRHAYVEKLIALWDLCRVTGYHEVHIATLPDIGR